MEPLSGLKHVREGQGEEQAKPSTQVVFWTLFANFSVALLVGSPAWLCFVCSSGCFQDEPRVREVRQAVVATHHSQGAHIESRLCRCLPGPETPEPLCARKPALHFGALLQSEQHRL